MTRLRNVAVQDPHANDVQQRKCQRKNVLVDSTV